VTRVSEVMTAHTVSVAPATCVEDAETLAQLGKVRHLLVMEASDLVGVLCVCDLRGEPGPERVAACMSSPVYTTDAEALVEEAANRMARLGIGCLPVTARGKIVGIVTRGDLRRAGMRFEEGLGGHFCAACGAHHQVARDPRMAEVWFCDDCQECAHSALDESRGEVLGSGD